MCDCKIELVVFDLGRVLVRICDDWGEAFERAGFVVPEEVKGLLETGVVGEAKEALLKNEVGAIGSEAFYEIYGQLFGVEKDVVAKVGKCYLQGKFEGVDELIADLKAVGVKTACLSNTNEAHWEIMMGRDVGCGCDEDQGGELGGNSALPLGELDFAWASHLMGDRKPNESIYWMAESLAGIKGERILFFDDLLKNVEAAKGCGWRAERIGDRDDPVGEMRGHLRAYGLLD
ncbi:D-glucose-1-phosphatase [Poriferisphaera corsica]|uniref:D-glucose-1-phosphatase n=1 Tax=Poriferisphaera corsica TaxID=2528020 RepID=A0A517YU44_9BACT|nr:HAD-IA family hydrolase [Poriferisphaera corsica]QDU33737.1 D-glucose-1-phosphatase [Poriferisphaera corsica]